MKHGTERSSRGTMAALAVSLLGLSGGCREPSRPVADRVHEVRAIPPEAPDAAPLLLTEGERAWLRAHPVIRVAQDPGWPPVEFADERGKPAGIAEDYLTLIERRLGMTFERVRGLSWQESYARLKRWELDMTTSVAPTSEREGFWAFTRPYLSVPLVILTRLDIPYVAGMRELSGKKVAVVEGYIAAELIPRDFPRISLVKVASVLEGLALLKRNEVFAFVDNMLVIGYYLTKMKWADLKIAGETPYVNAQSMAVRKDWPILAGLLERALDSISEEERSAIYRKWVPIRYEYGFNIRRLWLPLGMLAIILAGLATWNRILSREIRTRKKAERALLESERALRQAHERLRYFVDAGVVGVAIADPKGRILEANDYYLKTIGYSREEFMRGLVDWRALTPTEWLPADERAIAELRERGTCTPYEKEYARRDGTRVSVFLSDVMMPGPEEQIVAFVQDITERKRAEADLLQKMEELQRFHRLTVDRELRLIELKKEINALLRESGRREKHRIVE